MKYKNLERQDYELTCISPVHIGNGEILKPIDYIYDKENQRVLFLDEHKWKVYLSEHQLMEPFCHYLQKEEKEKNLWTWIENQQIPQEDIQRITKSTSHISAENASGLKAAKSGNEIQRFIKDGMGRPYIPGSSIKGCFRTSLLAYWINKNKLEARRYWRDIAKYKKEDKKCINRSMKYLENQAFLCLKNPRIKYPGMTQSCLRGLSISDAVCVEDEVDTVILRKIDAVATSLQENKISVFRECLPPGTKLRFSITFDQLMMREMGITSLAEVIRASRKFTKGILDKQKEIFEKTYTAEFKHAELADMLLGGGTGFQSKTIIYNLASSFEEGRQTVANKLYNQFGKYHDCRDTQISPRTLKLTRTTNDRWIMGLCSLKEV